MSIESFVKMLRPRVEARTPFLAYWHPGGVMVLNTGVVTWEEYTVRVGNDRKGFETYRDISKDQLEAIKRRPFSDLDDFEIIGKKKRRKTVSASTINKMRKIIAGLQKDPRIDQVYVVEFDGTTVSIDGPDPDVLSSLNLEVRS